MHIMSNVRRAKWFFYLHINCPEFKIPKPYMLTWHFFLNISTLECSGITWLLEPAKKPCKWNMSARRVHLSNIFISFYLFQIWYTMSQVGSPNNSTPGSIEQCESQVWLEIVTKQRNLWTTWKVKHRGDCSYSRKKYFSMKKAGKTKQKL